MVFLFFIPMDGLSKYACLVDFMGYANKDREKDKISCKDCEAKAPTILKWLKAEQGRIWKIGTQMIGKLSETFLTTQSY